MSDTETGIVVATRGRRFEVRADDGSLVQCEVRGKVKSAADSTTPVAVGDRVTFMRTHEAAGVIEEVAPRKTSFHRPDIISAERKQVIAANLDQLAIVVATKQPKLKTGLIDRFLIAARMGSLEPFIVLNKIDLLAASHHADVMEAYQAIGVPVFPVSAESGVGIDDLTDHLKDHISLFAGHSGVGKTTILNHLMPGLDLKTRKVSDHTDRGKHTTTSIELFELPTGGFFVDSPGLKVMGLWDVEAADLRYYYPEFEPLQDSCRFSSCSHTHEPNCAVKNALEEGRIAPFRYENYQQIYDGLSKP